MSLACIIVEDLQVAANYLEKCCEKSGQVVVKGHFVNVPDALAYLNENTVDLIFLDVEMPGANGFELLDQIAFSPKVILTTAKKEYAYNAFQYNVSDYLMKPFTYQRFMEALQKIQPSQETVSINNGSDHIYIKADGKLIRLNNDSILYIESMGNYVNIYTEGKKIIAYLTLKGLETQLPANEFIKIHQSYLVSFSKINSIEGNLVNIKNKPLPISRHYRDSVMQVIEQRLLKR